MRKRGAGKQPCGAAEARCDIGTRRPQVGGGGPVARGPADDQLRWRNFINAEGVSRCLRDGKLVASAYSVLMKLRHRSRSSAGPRATGPPPPPCGRRVPTSHRASAAPQGCVPAPRFRISCPDGPHRLLVQRAFERRHVHRAVAHAAVPHVAVAHGVHEAVQPVAARAVQVVGSVSDVHSHVTVAVRVLGQPGAVVCRRRFLQCLCHASIDPIRHIIAPAPPLPNRGRPTGSRAGRRMQIGITREHRPHRSIR